MCGVVGIFDFLRQSRVNRDVLEHMIGRLTHRGPDGIRTAGDERAGLACSRLSIIDLENGWQPMSAGSHVVAVCNGEIFNHRVLRDELERRGHRLRTRCDVEVIPYLYLEYGTSMFERLNGQFAAIIYDARRRVMVAARDHFGICPLFYTVAGGCAYFASEIKALLAHPDIPRRLDPIGLDQVLTFPGNISPRTSFAGISSIQPGHFVEVCPNGSIHDREYWDLNYPEDGEDADDDAHDETHELALIEELDHLLGNAVQLRLQADQPVGSYLSGGLDSSLVSAVMRRRRPSQAEFAAFSVDFQDKLLSEGKFQRFIARYLHATHHQQTLDQDGIVQRLRTVVQHSEQPLKESFNSATLMLSELAHQSGYRVVLAGQGADELFAGYVGYRMDAAPALRRSSQLDDMERGLNQRLWGDRDFVYEKLHGAFRAARLRLLSPQLRDVLSRHDAVEDFVVRRDRLDKRDALHRRSYIDVKLRLGDHLLSDHGDRMAMANAVEVRYPFLDLELVDFVTRLPRRLKLNGFTEKYILRRVAERYLPAPILQREKFGFAAPGSADLIKAGDEYIDTLLSPSEIRRRGVFDANEVSRVRGLYTQPNYRVNVPFETDLLMVVLTTGILQDSFDLQVH